ncbi:hypothetical protein QN277_028670 [Acacia crassicarpa]|uniref:Uncharacterized protein n=1 Tax=Acacia crassicarpa TaxID=499986 RepID=A0AAE1J3Q9_9FABA|nr:hypothetical protein QN277_028670 [Acacia crassicarpa]
MSASASFSSTTTSHLRTLPSPPPPPPSLRFTPTLRENRKQVTPTSTLIRKSNLCSWRSGRFVVKSQTTSAPASSESVTVTPVPSQMKAWVYGEYGRVDILKFDLNEKKPKFSEKEKGGKTIGLFLIKNAIQR